MKSASLALACALLGATALAPASFAQTSPGAPQTPAEASPSTTSPDANARTGTSAQRDWRDQDGRTGGWRSSRDDDDERFSSRDMRGGRYADDDDDDDDDMGPRGSGRYGHDDGRMGPGPMGSMDRDHGRGMHEGMEQGRGMMGPALMRQHMRMMQNQRGARFRLKRGDSQIDIRCPAQENISSCIDAVGKLMDRLQAMPQTPH